MSDRTATLYGLVLLAALGTPVSAEAADRVRQSGNIGVGLGATNFGIGAVGKYFVNEANAVQALVGVAESGTAFVVQADYLYNFDPILRDDQHTLGWYAGFGGTLSPGASELMLGVAGIIGLDFNLDVAPLDIYVEVRPTLILAPSADLRPVAAGSGVRYFF